MRFGSILYRIGGKQSRKHQILRIQDRWETSFFLYVLTALFQYIQISVPCKKCMMGVTQLHEKLNIYRFHILEN